jgi:hypothetical protein
MQWHGGLLNPAGDPASGRPDNTPPPLEGQVLLSPPAAERRHAHDGFSDISWALVSTARLSL